MQSIYGPQNQWFTGSLNWVYWVSFSKGAISGSKISVERWTTQWFRCCTQFVANVISKYWIQAWSRLSIRALENSRKECPSAWDVQNKKHIVRHNFCHWWFTMQTKTITWVELHLGTYTSNESNKIIQKPDQNLRHVFVSWPFWRSRSNAFQSSCHWASPTPPSPYALGRWWLDGDFSYGW